MTRVSGWLGRLGVAAMLAWQAAGPAAGAGPVLERVRERGEVNCGVDLTPGFSAMDTTGRARGFEVDFCRAIAAAALGTPDAIAVHRVNTANKFTALVAGEIDVAFGMTTWTFTRDTALGTAFPVVLFYDGQGLMAWADTGVRRLADAGPRRVCVQAGTTSAAGLEEVIRRDGVALQPLATGSSEEKFTAFAQRRCDLVTGDRSELAVRAATMAPGPGQWIVLPDVNSREPLGPAVAAGDPQWYALVRWVVLATLVAEARGVDSAGIAALADSPDPEIRRLAGGDPGFGTALGLDPRWAQRVIAGVGN
ncbi:amino acid ABC transporter substrate-binding protein [Azospirillum halopraeferens]|uniref:amino acid ABC transporter substrate-binding protein n=1 Tax=Azospirillum halopraeferens TaxID=34010 RepID=UPI00146FB6FA|nr:amino acid ABC transporter substrate-binding protein [Azospirillum halopraeferens]